MKGSGCGLFEDDFAVFAVETEKAPPKPQSGHPESRPIFESSMS